MGAISKVLGGGNAIVVGSTGASFYAGKTVGNSKTSIQNELSKIKSNIGDLFNVKPLSQVSNDQEFTIITNITKARRCTNYMWPGLKVGDPNSSATSDITGGCLHIDLKYSQERSVLAYIEMTLSDGKNGIIFGGQIAPARNHSNHVEFFWWRMDVDKGNDDKWKIGSGAAVQYNNKFGYINGKQFGAYNSISFKSYFFGETTDTVVDLFRLCSRKGLSAGKSGTSKNCDFSQDSPDLWVQKTKAYKWDTPTDVNGKEPNRHVSEVFDIKLNNSLPSSSLIWGVWRWQTVEGKSSAHAARQNSNFGNFTHYMTNGKWEKCVVRTTDDKCKNQTRTAMWGNWFTNDNVAKASKVVYKDENTNAVNLSMLKEF